MAAAIGLVEVDQVAERATSPALRGAIDLLRKHRDGHRDRDLVRPLRRGTNQVLIAVLLAAFHSVCFQRSDLNAALSSFVNSSGCSHAAKWPPFSTRL
jgi:hypothetical protein